MFSLFRPAAPAVPRISGIDAVLRAGRGDLTVIDVREPAELRASGAAEGALHAPLGRVSHLCDPDSPDCLPGLDRERAIAVYCASGARSAAAAAELTRLGYAAVYNLGTLGEWHAGGGRIRR